MKILYKASAVSTGGRSGRVVVEDSPLAFDMATPEELGGVKNTAANLEQLFAAGYAACFGSSVQHVIKVRKLSIPIPVIHTTVGMGRNETNGYSLAVDIVAVFAHGTDPAVAEELVREGHQVCPYSNATRGNIEVTVASRIE